MSANLDDFTYQLEEPSEKDIFVSKGHENTANAMSKTIEEHENIHIIGLEGALGAGKSTVINIIQSQLRDKNYHFICFDVDQHHHGSTKASFIKVFYSELTSSRIGVKSEAVNEAKDRALGNKFTYTKDVNSKLTYYVLFFLLSLAFSVKYLPEAVLNFFNTISLFINNNYGFSLKATVTSILGFSPLFVLAPVAVRSWYDKKERVMPSFLDKIMPGAPTFGNLLKKNSKDTIDEIIDVTRDVTSYELREAFKVFVDAIPSDKKIVLVIDNLDRLGDSKTKEVWSDLDVFTSVCNSRCKIILPFSEYHVAKALKDDGDINTGYEYISKRLPVVFRAPPIVSSGWREQFKGAYWDATLPNIDGVESCCKLIDIWESSERQITPRFLKKHVNDIACIISSSPIDNVSAVCCSAYLLSVKYSHVKIEELLSSDYPELDENVSEKEKNKIRKLTLTHKLLKKEMDVKAWSTLLACIHFQTTEDIAGSELLTEPSKTAMFNCDADRIIELSSLYGFNDKFSNVIEEAGFMESTKLLASVLELDDGSHVEFVEKWLPDINHLSKLEGLIPDFDQRYIEALVTLNEYKLKEKLDLTHLKREIRKLGNLVKNKPSQDILEKLYQYCRVEAFKPNFVSKPTADFFLDFLWPGRESFKIWNVAEIDPLNEGFRPQVLSIACQEYKEKGSENLSSFFKWMISNNSVAVSPEHKTLLVQLDFSLDGGLIIGDWIYTIPYDKRWGSTSMVSFLLGVLSKNQSVMSNGDKEDECAAFCAAILASAVVSDSHNKNITFHNERNQQQTGQVLGILKKYLDKSNLYESYLVDYLTFSTSLRFLVERLENNELRIYIERAVREIIVKRRYRVIDLEYFLGGGYSLICSVLNESERVDFVRMWGLLKTESLVIERISEVFIKDALGGDVSGWHEKIRSYFNSDKHSVEFWVRAVDDMSPSMRAALEWMVDAALTIKRCSALSDALKGVLSQKDDRALNEYDKSENICLLMKVLPSRSVDSVAVVYRERLLADTASLSERYAIIRNFGDFLSMPLATSNDGRTRCITLIDNAKESVIVDWLNDQDWGFNEWPRHLISQILDVLKDKSENFDVRVLITEVEGYLQVKA